MSAEDRKLAEKLLRRGQEREAGGAPENLDRAIRCYSKAASLWPESDLRGQGLVFMNRGNVRAKIGARAGAVEDYDRAISFLERAASSGDDAGLRNSLGAAWMNRGQTVLAGAAPGAALEAQRCQLKAIEILGALDPAAGSPARINLGGAWLNYARAALAEEKPSPKRVAAAASRALEQVRDAERADPLAAEISLKARHTLCAARALERTDVAEDVETVEEALGLLRHWETRLPGRFRPLAPSLYRFGARLHLVREPSRLACFLLASLDPLVCEGAMPDFPALHAVAAESLAQALSDNYNLRLSASDGEAMGRLESLAATLHRAEGRRAELQSLWVSPGKE